MAAPVIALAVMAGLQLYQGFSQAQSMRDQADFNRRMNDINARQAELRARDALLRGEETAVKYGQSVRGFVGSQKAALAAQGIDIGSGDAASIIEETRMAGSENISKIRSNAFRESLGLIAEGEDARMRGRIGVSTANAEASQTILAGGLRAAGTGYQAFGKG